MNKLHPAAVKILLGAFLLGIIYLLLITSGSDHDLHEEDGIHIEGHEDHQHVTYRPVVDVESETIVMISAYLPHTQTKITIYDGLLKTGHINSDCTDFRDWAISSFEPVYQEELSEREFRELRNLYSRITPDFRIETLPEDEDYGLTNPDGCLIIQTDNRQYFLQFGRQSTQGFSRYLRVNQEEPVYVVSRYFYTELQLLAQRD